MIDRRNNRLADRPGWFPQERINHRDKEVYRNLAKQHLCVNLQGYNAGDGNLLGNASINSTVILLENLRIDNKNHEK